MATQKLEETVQQHDEVVESSKTGCRSRSRAHGKVGARGGGGLQPDVAARPLERTRDMRISAGDFSEEFLE